MAQSFNLKKYQDDAIRLLNALIQTPSFSGVESQTANIIQRFLQEEGIPTNRHLHNVWAINQHEDPAKPYILLNSHHDTVKPNTGYTRDPFVPTIEDSKLYGLGSNDAGGPLVSLIQSFIHFYDQKNLPFNLIMAATAEEENSGKNGIESILPLLPVPDVAIVGEPTGMQLSVAEKGLMVIDAVAVGQSGHAARNNGINAIYVALEDIRWIQQYEFDEVSPWLGKINMAVTMIEAGKQHNVIPDRCRFVIDIRVTEKYDMHEVLQTLQQHVKSVLTPRSMRLKPSFLPEHNIAYQAGCALSLNMFGSPTSSDQALMNFPSCKIGPGLSERSHTADEFIELAELEQGIEGYITFLSKIFELKSQ